MMVKNEDFTELELGHRYLIEGTYKVISRVDDPRVLITDIFDHVANE